MLSFAQLAPPLKSLLLTLLFVSTCVGVCLFPGIRRTGHRPLMVLEPAATLLCGAVLVLYDAHVKCFKPGWTRYGPVERFAGLPLVLTLSLFALIVLILALSVREEQRYRAGSLTHAAIKDSIDHLPTGLCFAHPDGRVMLVNHRMNALCHTLSGGDLQDAEALWGLLVAGDLRPPAVRLSAGEQPSVRLPDGEVWTFGRERLGDVIQLTAAETSRLSALAGELEEKNAALRAMNLRLRQHGENIMELAKERELLEIKARIHRELGRALLSTRRYLQEDGTDAQELLRTWKRNISLLRGETELPREAPRLGVLTELAASSGIRVEISGQMPGRHDIAQLFFEAAVEALTNAVSHAKAKTVWIRLEETREASTVRFTNDGAAAGGGITEGGGLGSLRRKAESRGGSMEIRTEPRFSLTITIPGKRGDADVL